MTVELDVGGRRRGVNVRRVSEGWVVTTDGRDEFASVASINGRWSLLLRAARAGHLDPAEVGQRAKSYELVVESRRPDVLSVTVNGQAIAVTLTGVRAARSRRRHQGGSLDDGPRKILAPMPGRIVRVLAAPGDVVAARQGLVVVEAMKMENELRAPAAGTVRAIHVTVGSAVEANALLVELE